MENQPEPTLIEFIRYNNWANAQILAVCLKLTPEQLAASAPGTYGTIHATLAHIITAETSYIRRLTGVRPEPPFKWEDRPALSGHRRLCADGGTSHARRSGQHPAAADCA